MLPHFCALAALLAALVVSPPASANSPAPPLPALIAGAELVQNFSSGPTFFHDAAFQVARFDPALGQLDSVTISGDLGDAWFQALEFYCDSMPGTGEVDFDNRSETTVKWGGLTLLDGIGGTGWSAIAANAFDGTNDGDGSSGVHATTPIAYSLGSTTLTDARSLKAWTGTGTVALQAHLDFLAHYYAAQPGACGSFGIAGSDALTFGLQVSFAYH